MKFYLASGLDNRDRALAMIEALEKIGHVCTYRWPEKPSVNGFHRFQQVAEVEVDAVKEADVLLVWLPGWRGTHTELGVALGRAKPVILMCEDETYLFVNGYQCPFHHHPAVKQLLVGNLNPEKISRAMVSTVTQKCEARCPQSDGPCWDSCDDIMAHDLCHKAHTHNGALITWDEDDNGI